MAVKVYFSTYQLVQYTRFWPSKYIRYAVEEWKKDGLNRYILSKTRRHWRKALKRSD